MPKYSKEFKKEVADYYKNNSLYSTAKVYNVSKTAIYKWARQAESGNFMRKKSKIYTVDEKLKMIDYYKRNGIKSTEDKFNIAKYLIYKWERTLLEYGVEGLAVDNRRNKLGVKKSVDKNEDLLDEVQRLRIENMYLKKLRALVKERNEQENKNK